MEPNAPTRTGCCLSYKGEGNIGRGAKAAWRLILISKKHGKGKHRKELKKTARRREEYFRGGGKGKLEGTRLKH